MFVEMFSDGMEQIKLEQDIKVFCVEAQSFPHDIGAAFNRLVSLVLNPDDRVFFGISYQANDGTIIYKAAVKEERAGEGKQLGCEEDVVRKGTYLAETIKDWRKDIGSIGSTFKKMADSKLNTTFPCVEWYKGDDVTCMVRLLVDVELETNNRGKTKPRGTI
jgi:hypothetical protein